MNQQYKASRPVLLVLFSGMIYIGMGKNLRRKLKRKLGL